MRSALSKATTNWGAMGIAILVATAAARGEVRLELRIPPAEAYVIGDAIPLYWRFSNLSTQALGFMWEGCCRLNGKLEVRSAQGSLPTFPVGQALAHMFAKADQLDPGVPKEYDTKVGDWIQLEASGSYQLQGTYRGVLPSQFPQVRRGLALWRDAAQSAPIALSVLTVAEYHNQRATREQQRGLRLTLSGPQRLPPLQPTPFRVRIENTSDKAVRLTWPDEEALWVLDARDRRVAPAAVMEGATEPLEIPARGHVERSFTLSSDRFESESFGEYSLFVDLQEGEGGAPRVPSNRHSLTWKLDAEQVRNLVASAAGGAGTGARNAPLKLLRVYLGELGPTLATLDKSALPLEAVQLADRLALAAALKPIAPKPGTVELELGLSAQGEAFWTNPLIPGALASIDPSPEKQALQILGIRRHLGWELAVRFVPAEDAPVHRVVQQLSRWKALTPDWASVPAVVLSMGASNAPVRWRSAESGSAPAIPRMEIDAAGRRWTPASASAGGAGSGAASEEALRAYSGLEEIQVLADPAMTWGRLRKQLEPLLRPGRQFVLSLLPTVQP
ncbi:MAG: hypothetical protein JNK85_02670 [Verrucomicrobiales bacterium]|nr:hypothetical protein [Verrucomicrobiales bacterium]